LGVTCSLPKETAIAQAKDAGEARNVATVEAGFDAWKKGTGSPYDLLADDAAWTTRSSRPWRSSTASHSTISGSV
jgi:hypothetical protein